MKITLNKDQKIFFFSDPHYNHSNICSATTTWKNAEDVTRKFDSLEQMNDTIVNNINSIAGQDDIVFCLGDWSFGGFDQIEKFRSRIICKNIHLVLGNHDHHIERNKEDIQSLFSSVQYFIPYLLIKREKVGNKGMMEKFELCLFHYPIASWIGMNDGVIHLHGHVHLPEHQKTGKGRHLDVGLDGNNMKPYSLEDVLVLVGNKPIRKLELPSDHHEKRI